MLTDALVLSAFSTLGFILTYQKLPKTVQRFLVRHGVFTDIVTFGLTYVTLGSSLTALTAGAMVAIFTSMLIHIAANPNDFMYLYDLRDYIKDLLNSTKARLSDYGQKYRESKQVQTGTPTLQLVQ
jgi:hypothetical protein